jgi:hypothetical protein
MTSIERHKELLRQSLNILDIVLAGGLLNNPRAIAFATSSGSVDLLSILLHKTGKLSLGRVIEHQWFKKPLPMQKIKPIYERKLDMDFPKKKAIFSLMCDIEEKRNILAYGNPSDKDISLAVDTFRTLKNIVEEEIGEKLE